MSDKTPPQNTITTPFYSYHMSKLNGMYYRRNERDGKLEVFNGKWTDSLMKSEMLQLDYITRDQFQRVWPAAFPEYLRPIDLLIQKFRELDTREQTLKFAIESRREDLAGAEQALASIRQEKSIIAQKVLIA